MVGMRWRKKKIKRGRVRDFEKKRYRTVTK